ncbi:MAG: M24 family metallopeptidase [Candidatus Hodarchaeota archaeon]
MKDILNAVKSPPSKEELSQRLEKVRIQMNNYNLDYYISFDPINVYYLTNFANKVHERPFILVIPKDGVPKMVVPTLEEEHVRERLGIELECINYYEFPAPHGKNWYDVYRNLINKNAVVGVESAMPLKIAEKTPGKHKIIDIIDEIRLVKSDYEIGRSIHSCQIANLGATKLFEICRPKVPEITIYKEISAFMMAKIITDIPNFNVIVSSTAAAVWPPSISHNPHIIPKMFTLMEDGGPHVFVVIVQADGYGVEIERTFFLETVPKKAEIPFEIMLKARELAYSLIKPGVYASEIDKKVRTFIKDKGFGDYIIHRTGHGLGITGHEAPYIAEGYEHELIPGMLISIEPGIYIPGLGGFRHSDTVLVTDEGYVKLTQFPDQLDDLIIPI